MCGRIVGAMTQADLFRFEIGRVWLDPPGIAVTRAVDAFTNIDGDLRFYLGDKLFLHGTVCVVEFAAALERWRNGGPSRTSTFHFASADDDEPNIFSFEISDDGVRMWSGWQEFTAEEMLGVQPFEQTLMDFVEAIVERCQEDLFLDVRPWLN